MTPDVCAEMDADGIEAGDRGRRWRWNLPGCRVTTTIRAELAVYAIGATETTIPHR
jgi:hypothetical protein